MKLKGMFLVGVLSVGGLVFAGEVARAKPRPPKPAILAQTMACSDVMVAVIGYRDEPVCVRISRDHGRHWETLGPCDTVKLSDLILIPTSTAWTSTTAVDPWVYLDRRGRYPEGHEP